MAFPPDIPLPDQVHEGRELRLRELTGASFRAMGLRGLLIIIECLGFWLFSAHCLLLDALSSCLDLLGSLILIICLRTAKIPPDENHPFGHGRIEPIAGLLLALLMIQVGIYLTWTQLSDISPTSLSLDPRAALFALAAFGLMQISYYMMKRYGEKHQSSAILAEAAHYRIDALNSIIAAVALILGSFSHESSFLFDRLGAGIIALMMVYLGFRSAKNNIDQLIDRKPAPELFQRIERAALAVEGVKETEKIRIQHYGPDAHVDIDVEVDPLLSVHQAHTISQHVRRAIQIEWPSVRDVTVHIEPYFPGDHRSA